MAGAAHSRRQKHREMPPPGASAPAFTATAEPTSIQITSGIPPTYLQSDSSNKRVLKMACCMHRFLISSPDFRIDVSLSTETSFCVHRFLISGPDLGIDASFSPFTPSCVHRFLISSPNLGIDASFSPITPFCVHRFLISGSNLGINAAEKSSACSGRSGNEVRVRFYSSLPQRRMVPPAAVVAATRSASDSILRCRKGEWFRLLRS